jgi:chromodomain-helicase-DNA-binding protein 4
MDEDEGKKKDEEKDGEEEKDGKTDKQPDNTEEVMEVDKSENDGNAKGDETETSKKEEDKESDKKAKSPESKTNDKNEIKTNESELVKALSSTSKTPESINPAGVKLHNGQPIKSLQQLQTELRDRFWVSDGGFTELHAVWNHEESMLLPAREWEVWHRRHDFWLLAGVVTYPLIANNVVYI